MVEKTLFGEVSARQIGRAAAKKKTVKVEKVDADLVASTDVVTFRKDEPSKPAALACASPGAYLYHEPLPMPDLDNGGSRFPLKIVDPVLFNEFVQLLFSGGENEAAAFAFDLAIDSSGDNHAKAYWDDIFFQIGEKGLKSPEVRAVIHDGTSDEASKIKRMSSAEKVAYVETIIGTPLSRGDDRDLFLCKMEHLSSLFGYELGDAFPRAQIESSKKSGNAGCFCPFALVDLLCLLHAEFEREQDIKKVAGKKSDGLTVGVPALINRGFRWVAFDPRTSDAPLGDMELTIIRRRFLAGKQTEKDIIYLIYLCRWLLTQKDGPELMTGWQHSPTQCGFPLPSEIAIQTPTYSGKAASTYWRQALAYGVSVGAIRARELAHISQIGMEFILTHHQDEDWNKEMRKGLRGRLSRYGVKEAR